MASHVREILGSTQGACRESNIQQDALLIINTIFDILRSNKQVN